MFFQDVGFLENRKLLNRDELHRYDKPDGTSQAFLTNQWL